MPQTHPQETLTRNHHQCGTLAANKSRVQWNRNKKNAMGWIRLFNGKVIEYVFVLVIRLFISLL